MLKSPVEAALGGSRTNSLETRARTCPHGYGDHRFGRCYAAPNCIRRECMHTTVAAVHIFNAHNFVDDISENDQHGADSPLPLSLLTSIVHLCKVSVRNLPP